MKTLIYLSIAIITLLALMNSNTATAQNTRQNNSRFGIKGGINVSNLLTEDAESGSIKLGINSGVFLRVAVNDLFAFQPELIYTMKGGKLTYTNLVNGEVKMALNYLEVPLLVVLNITKNINLHSGIYLASLSDVHIKNKSNDINFNFEEELNKDDFNTFDYGLVIGIGGDFEKLSVGIRYDYGIRSVGKKMNFGGETHRFPDARNSTFQIYMGLSIL